MLVTCKHGFIEYRPEYASELYRFQKLFGFGLKPEFDYFTFDELIGLPRYSIQGHPYANLVGLKNYEGRSPGEVFEENGFVYSIPLKVLVPKEAIVSTIQLTPTLGYIVCNGPFVQPGAFISPGQRLLDFGGILDLDRQRLIIYDAKVGV